MNSIAQALAQLPPEQQSEWEELQQGAVDPLDTLTSWTPEHRRAVRVGLSGWVRAQPDPHSMLGVVVYWSRRLGVMLACDDARETLRYVPAGEARPLLAIETAERWARTGAVPPLECRDAAYASEHVRYLETIEAALSAAGGSAACASITAAHSANAVSEAAEVSKAVAADNARWSQRAAYEMRAYISKALNAANATVERAVRAAVPSAPGVDGRASRAAEARRLRGVVADALLVGPVAEWIG